MAHLDPYSPKAQVNMAFNRADSLSSHSAATVQSTHTADSSSEATPHTGNSTSQLPERPFVTRNGRTYLNDPKMQYPLPIDLTELHRQSLKTLLMIQVLGAPICCPSLQSRPPLRVLETGCGAGFWSMMCHRYFKNKGYSNISFTGIDIAPLAPGSGNDTARPDPDMDWTFIQHDLRQIPWPMPDGHFDLIMSKDLSLVITNACHQDYLDQCMRLLSPGGTLELWDSDHTIRMLRPHIPSSGPGGAIDVDDQESASRLGAYVLTPNTPLSAPLNTFLVECNNWLQQALLPRDLSPVPCSILGPLLLQECETLNEVRSRRLAIPLSEVRWEREGLSGVVTKDGKSYVETKNKSVHATVEKKSLTSAQSALRYTALLTVVEQFRAMENVLREASGKNGDEWDAWVGKMMADLMSGGGTSWGECLEIGAWWAKKM